MESKRSPYRKHLYVCVNRREEGRACCAARGGEAIKEKLKAYVQDHGLKGRVRISSSGCMDLCEQGANVMVYPDQRWYSHVTLEDLDGIFEEHLAPLVSANHPELPIRAFLFDLGNTLVRFDHMQAARKIVNGTGASPEALFQLFFESPLVVAHDEGRLSTREFYEGVKKEIRLNLPYDRFLEVWNDIFTEDLEMMKLLRRLLMEYPCYLISNTNRPHFEYLRANYPILNDLQGSILSYEVGHLKPHPVIYQRALERVGLPAGQILYVDDRSDLIEAARPHGFLSHHFTAAPGLLLELEGFGIRPVL